MVDFVTALATASQALKLLNDLCGIDKAYDQAELKLKIADLTTALADLKIVLSDARDELNKKQSEIEDLKNLMKRKADLVEVAGYKYDKNTDGQPTGAPYCPVCEQKLGLLIHITHVLHTQQCPSCQGYFRVRDFP
jgi:DNA repair exonuclease SbcCD ATPase subunit